MEKPSERERERYLEALMAKIRVQEYENEIIFSLYEGNRSVAEIYVLDYSEGFNAKSKVYFLETLEVDEEFRGRGYASALLERFNRFLKSQGAIAYLKNGAYSEIELWDIKSRKPISIKSIYERHGYKYIDENYGYMANLSYANKDDAEIFLSEFHYIYGRVLQKKSA